MVCERTGSRWESREVSRYWPIRDETRVNGSGHGYVFVVIRYPHQEGGIPAHLGEIAISLQGFGLNMFRLVNSLVEKRLPSRFGCPLFERSLCRDWVFPNLNTVLGPRECSPH